MSALFGHCLLAWSWSLFLLFVLVMASSALCHETIGERELQSGVAVCILEKTTALDSIRVLLTVKLVAE